MLLLPCFQGCFFCIFGNCLALSDDPDQKFHFTDYLLHQCMGWTAVKRWRLEKQARKIHQYFSAASDVELPGLMLRGRLRNSSSLKKRNCSSTIREAEGNARWGAWRFDRSGCRLQWRTVFLATARMKFSKKR